MGKWMDGWETRRRRSPRLNENFDWCIIRLGFALIIHGGVVEATYLRGVKIYEQGQFAANAIGALLTR